MMYVIFTRHNFESRPQLFYQLIYCKLMNPMISRLVIGDQVIHQPTVWPIRQRLHQQRFHQQGNFPVGTGPEASNPVLAINFFVVVFGSVPDSAGANVDGEQQGRDVIAAEKME
jgi:hypothetical protein